MNPHTSTVSINITNRCNLSCSHCGNAASSPALPSSEKREMSRRELFELFKTLQQEGVTYVGIAGGEPLLRSDFPGILRDLARCRMRCMLLTNGVLLDAAKIQLLVTSGVVDAVRMSIEYPDSCSATSRSLRMCHPTKKTLQRVAACTKAGLTTGVNMTLFPDNLLYVNELASAARDAGAAFFRAVPVFPVGGYSNKPLPETFLAQCIESILNVHAAVRGTTTATDKRITRQNFTCACGAGATLFSVDADGTLSGCPLIAAPRKPLRWNEGAFPEVARRIRARTTALQRAIVDNRSGQHRAVCRGGCIAEWDSRGRIGGQPLCYVDAIGSVKKQYLRGSAELRVLGELSASIGNARLFNVQTPCLRSQPIWTVRFD